MQITSITFTCPRDAAKAAAHAALLPTGWRKIWCVESKHAAQISAPEGVELLVRDFPRGGTLRGDLAVRGMAAVYLELAESCDLLVKIDSDTALYRPEAFTAPAELAEVDFVYIRRHEFESRLLCNGCCYAVSKRALKRLSHFYPGEIPKQYKGHEDLIFSSFWTTVERDLTLCQINKTKVFWCTAPYDGVDCICAHYGYMTAAEAHSRMETHLNKKKGQ